jgi:hypothetical protein
MLSVFLSFFMAFAPLAQQQGNSLPFDIRANKNLLMGKGEKTKRDYYDVVVTQQPTSGVLIKLPYTRKGGKFTFDLHHRIALTNDFPLPADVMTVVEVISGGTTSLGSFTLSDKIESGAKFEENIIKTSSADIDKYVTPLSRKTISIKTIPGPQSVSIVGKSVIITRGANTVRNETPGARIATVSNFIFEETSEGIRLSIDK